MVSGVTTPEDGASHIPVPGLGSKSMNPEEEKQWKNTRKGFKHELILTLRELDFSFREAAQAIDAIFLSIKEALLRKEDVGVEGFGRWYVGETPREKRRKWRFGKVIQLKPYKVLFEIDANALSQSLNAQWKPHPSWESGRKAKPKLRGRKLALFLQQQEQQRRDLLLTQYSRTILKFLTDELYLEDPVFFWVLRHNSGWFYGEATEIPATEKRSVPFMDAAEVIKATKSDYRYQKWSNGAIEAVRWYARWSTRLKVEPDIWKEAEQLVSSRR